MIEDILEMIHEFCTDGIITNDNIISLRKVFNNNKEVSNQEKAEVVMFLAETLDYHSEEFKKFVSDIICKFIFNDNNTIIEDIIEWVKDFIVSEENIELKDYIIREIKLKLIINPKFISEFAILGI